MSDDLTAPLPIAIPDDFVQCVVEGAEQGHAIESRQHVPEEGADAFTFGTGRWRRSWYFIRQALELAGYKVLDDGQVLKAWCSGYGFTFYNGGIGATWDPLQYNPAKSARRAQQAHRNQLVLDFPDLETEAEIAELSFVFAGSPEHGLEAVYLGLPLSSTDPWAWVREVWRRQESDGRAPHLVEPESPRFPAFRDLAAPEPVIEVIEVVADEGRPKS